MADTKQRLGTMLFNYETTNKTDYRGGDLKGSVVTKYKPKKNCLMVRPAPLKDVHTLSNWKDVGIPFSLLHKPKEIVGTNPNQLQKRYKKTVDTGLEEAVRTRPRLVMTPAVCMDDITDSHTRDLLLGSMYISTAAKAQRDVEKPCLSVKAPLPTMPAPANPVTLQKFRPPMVPLEWRMESVSWDGQQTRSHCDQTKEFWVRREPPQHVP